ncbi:MAG: AarF/ABC1/UbiB kinase family protein [Candidatus Poribacteria bacterium]|nr:AarF/ABC1/UbiB kinase family protein [Candidatus Poribacteria bacterium]
MPIPSLNRTFRSFQRLRQIVNVFAKHGFGHIIAQMNLGRYAPRRWRLFRFRQFDADEPITPLSVPERLRLAFEELGPTFIKLAQILSTRPDLISAIVGQEEALDWIQEFKKLQSQAQPFPLAEVRTIVESDLRQPLDQVFGSFDPAPFAAASIAQVHTATLRTGERVIVKVQRPHIAEVINADLNLLNGLAKRLEKYVVETRLYKPTELVREFARSIRREIDFTMEAANTDYFHRSISENKNVKIPKVYWEFTNRRVLTLERIDGLPIDAVQKLDELGLDRERIAETLVDFFFKQIFIDGFFHSDPHPGNLLVLEDGRLGLVDFGMVGRISGEMLDSICSWFIGVINRDVDRIIKTYIRMGILGDTTNTAALKLEMTDFLDRYFNMPLSRIRIGTLLEEVIDASLRYQVHFPPAFLMLGKTVVTIEAVVMNLNENFDLLAFSQPYITRLVMQQFEPERWAKQMYGTVEDFAEMAAALPLQLHQILQKLQKGNLKLELDHTNLDRLTGVFDRVSNRVSFSLIIAALIIGSSILLQDVSLWEYKSILGLMGYLTAGIFGVGLVISILRSGRF